MTWLFDTCAVSSYLARNPKKRSPELLPIWSSAQLDGIFLASATVYELRRGARELRLRDEGLRLEVDLEKLLRSVYVLPLDDFGGKVWRTAAEIWARGRTLKQHVSFGEVDLLIAATAIANARTLVTMDRGLSKALAQVGHADAVHFIAPPVSES